MNSDRHAMAEEIAKRGPMHGDEIRASMGWQIDRFRDAIFGSSDRWFIMTFVGWELTEFGRSNLAAGPES